MRSVLVLITLRFILVLLMTLIDDCTATSYRWCKACSGVASERHWCNVYAILRVHGTCKKSCSPFSKVTRSSCHSASHVQKSDL